MQADAGYNARWLLCCNAATFLDAARRLIECGSTGGIEWEPSCARALGRLSQTPPPGVNVIVGPGCADSDAPSAAYACAASQGAAVTVLVDLRAVEVVGEATERGVDVTVTPQGLPAVLRGLHDAWKAAKKQTEVAPSAPSDAERVSPATRAVGASECVDAASHASAAGLRASGRLPRTGVEEELVSTRANASERMARLPQVEANDPYELLAPVGGPACEEASGASQAASEVQGSTAVQPDAPSPAVQLIRERPSSEVELAEVRVLPVVNVPGTSSVPTICLASARGGVGKSSLAACMALSLARDGLRVALLDMDYQFGTCLGFLGAEEIDGLPDPPKAGDALLVDERVLARCRSQVEMNLAAYEFCHLPEQAEIMAPWTGRLLDAARCQADVAIVDLPAGIGEAQIQAFERADRCLLVSDQRALSLESLAAAAALCVRAGIPRTKLVSVLNRLDARHRDEGFVTRAGFELQTPQVIKVFDGGAEVTNMLSMGAAGELLNIRNRFALSAADAIHALCADLGCQAQAPAEALWQPPAQNAKRRKRAARKEMAACPC